MSRNKRGGAADGLFTNHLKGSQFATNTTVNREQAIEFMYQRVLTELCANRFKWTGLPDSIDVRFMEMTLFYHALSVFYFEEDLDQFLALKGGGTNYLNMLDNPTAFQVIGNNFVGKTVSAKKAVPIWANYMRRPDLDIVNIYSHKLATFDRTIEINAENARQNKVLVANENQRLTVVNINRQVAEGVNGVKVGGAVQDLSFIQALDLGIDADAIEKIDIIRARQWNVAMGLLGIQNANQDKTERLVSGEIDANDAQVASMRQVNLNARQMAAEQINKKFGGKLKAEVKVEYFTDAQKTDDQLEMEENGPNLEAVV